MMLVILCIFVSAVIRRAQLVFVFAHEIHKHEDLIVDVNFQWYLDLLSGEGSLCAPCWWGIWCAESCSFQRD